MRFSSKRSYGNMREEELEEARHRILEWMKEPQNQTSLLLLNEELFAIDAELEHLRQTALVSTIDEKRLP
jgi:hypothetical protein